MNDFLFDIKYTSIDSTIEYINQMTVSNDVKQNMVYSNNKSTILWIGDFILPSSYGTKDDFFKRLQDNFNLTELLSAGGFYYCIRILKKEKVVQFFSSFLNILPIYYFAQEDRIIVSSNINKLVSHDAIDYDLSKAFILEKLLFNYPFKNKTIFKGIFLLSGNHFLEVNQKGYRIERNLELLNWIVEDPLGRRDSIKMLKELFNQRVKSYLPDEEYYLSFTGGFDGRTLLSSSIYNNKHFICYSFGTKLNQDVVIPLNQSKALGIQYKPFYLDDNKYINESLQSGLELVWVTGSMSNLARAHYVYAAKEISKTNKYIITGNFGSEIFRAVHNSGVFVTSFLFGLFNTNNIYEFIDKYPYNELKILNISTFKDELDSLKDELINDYYFNHRKEEKNKFFYKYVFEELFRKYFGAEIMMQNKYLFNRAPYLDYEFMKGVLSSSLAGVYSDFYEHNPIKRFKGQLLYGHIIKHNSNELYKMKTGKGYRPSDLVNPLGKSNLIMNLIKKRMKKVNVSSDSFGVMKALNHNIEQIQKIPINDDLFSRDNFQNSLQGKFFNENNLLNAISLNWFINKAFPLK